MPINLMDVFYSNSRINIDFRALDELTLLIKDKIIKVTKNDFVEIGDYHKTVDELNSHNIKEFNYQGGNCGHMALKVLAEKFLQEKNKNAKIETLFYNRYPDIISGDEEIIIECGDTDPNKIIEYFKLGILKIYILPYPNSENHHLEIYEFTSELETLNEYIKFKENFYNNQLKEIIKKRRP